MRFISRRFLLLPLLAIALSAGALYGQSYTMTRTVIGSGGVIGASSSSTPALNGIMGQVAVGAAYDQTPNPTIQLFQGFWLPVKDTTTGVNDPIETNLSGLKNYPNPFSVSTTISYTLPGAAIVSLRIYSANGELVSALFEGNQDAGQKEITWNAVNNGGGPISSGTYIYELKASPVSMVGSDAFMSFVNRGVMVVVK